MSLQVSPAKTSTIPTPIKSPQKTKDMALEAIPLDISDSNIEVQAEKVKLPPIRSEDIQASINKAKRLEEDMAEVLGFLSKKLEMPAGQKALTRLSKFATSYSEF